ncbi:MAG TPA: RNA methyltransferase [Candidatus Magasanikbacteria bacterium]|nr:RNA methyltransferase [Candidatus Magasanikbacteria bacterium]
MKPQLSLILPNIRSCHNVGAMFRTADACGFNKIYLVGYTPVPPRPEIDKVALGAEKTVPWEHKKSLARLITSLKKEGYAILALEKTKKSVDLGTITKKLIGTKIALIVGNEVDGIDTKSLQKSDIVTHIPMRGMKESLNVSVAAGIAMYHIGHLLHDS